MRKLFERVESLYICPWSLQDPLCKSQSLAYIRGLVADGLGFTLITFESGRYPLSDKEIRAFRESLRKEGIRWYPVKWASGTSVGGKLFSFMAVILKGFLVCIKHRPRIIHSRSSLTVFLSVLLKKLFFAKFIYDSDSLLSLEYADTGHLSRGSAALRLLEWTEAAGRRNADHIIVLTRVLRDDYVNRLGVSVPIEVIPCCVDLKRFESAAQLREERRGQLGISDSESLFIYVGKYGSWYLIDETFELFNLALERDPSCRLLIVSPDPAEYFEASAEKAGVPSSTFSVFSATFDEVGGWMASADVALSLVKPLTSKRGSSPVKFAEYLACGLPVITTSGIGDTDWLVEENKIGAILMSFDRDGYAKVLDEISDLQGVKDRAIEVACSKFSLDPTGIDAYRRVYSSVSSR